MTTYKVGPKGQVVVPKAIREAIGLHPGDEVEVALDGEEIRVRRVSPPKTIHDFRGIAGPGDGMRSWDAEKRRERELEDRKDRRWSPAPQSS
ncbi:MAG: AbrB/MazE/SpoVT family DNA-binding domain-containing protein [Solirubrobacterales bacterium]|nr:AbrB/MazE/SpoVT family DNA-binding domain-containing protein [Solirubrobacterales bacterium]